jgi:SAM-dependent methyltransferase
VTDAPHSALYLTDLRDSWWNADYLALLAQRMELAGARDVLDVGCGKGHFTRVIGRLAPNARITGVDFEPQWVAAARASVPPGDSERFTYVEGSALSLPFGDGEFDVVTCQTLLIHLPDVRGALAEFARVLRPGGRVVACEPNNLAENFARLVADPRFDLDDTLAFVKLEAICEKGKHALGLGYNSTGEALCGSFASAGLVDVHVWNNDRCQLYLPPHSAEAHAQLDQDRAHFDSGALIWPLDETKRYYAAAGGDEAAFADLWERARRAWSTRLSMSHAANEGGLMYIVTGKTR